MVAGIEAGASVSEVSRRHNVPTSLLFRWRRELVEGTLPPSLAVLPVAIAPPAVTQAVPAGAKLAVTIEITLGNGRHLRVPQDVDVATLNRIAAASLLHHALGRGHQARQRTSSVAS